MTSSPAALIGLLDCPGPQSLVRPGKDEQAKGLLWMLEEEALFPGASEESLMEKLAGQYTGPSDSREQTTCSHIIIVLIFVWLLHNHN